MSIEILSYSDWMRYAKQAWDDAMVTTQENIEWILSQSNTALEKIHGDLHTSSLKNRVLLAREKLHNFSLIKNQLRIQWVWLLLMPIVKELKELETHWVLPAPLEWQFCDIIREFQNCPLWVMFHTGQSGSTYVIDNEFNIHHLPWVKKLFAQ